MKEYRVDLKPCPFCGGVPYVESCDRLIQIGCNVCKFTIYDYGLITPIMTPVKVNSTEFFNYKAHKEIEKRWNRRIESEKK